MPETKVGEVKPLVDSEDEIALVERMKAGREKIARELRKVIVGQDAVVDELLTAIFSRGHCILEGVPGLAKTLAIKALAKTIHVDFSRIQFTPDLLPADLIGTLIYSQKNEEFSVKKGSRPSAGSAWRMPPPVSSSSGSSGERMISGAARPSRWSPIMWPR